MEKRSIRKILTFALILAVSVGFMMPPAQWITDGESTFAETTETLEDGKYIPSSFSYTGGTGKVTITCPWVRLEGGKAYAYVVFHSIYYTKYAVNGTVYETKINEAAGEASAEIPVNLNGETSISATTVRMSSPHDITYTLNIGLQDPVKKYEENTQPDHPRKDDDKDDSKDDHRDSGKDSKYFSNGVLKDGTYRVQARTDNRMFYIQPADDGKTYAIIKAKNGEMMATFTLTGMGYDKLFAGTIEQAKASSEEDMSHAVIKNNWYSYVLPVSHLNRDIPVSSHSKKRNQWYSHTMYFSSKNIVRTSAENSIPSKNTPKKKRKDHAKSGKQTKFKNDHKKDKVSKYKDDSSGSTVRVNSSASLKDGVYTPSFFSWSGGSGRLKGIVCNKVTVTGGRAYATIRFLSTHYDSLRADGRVFSGQSTFVIPVRLNANNVIIGRTTAMSQPHWIKYTIYIGMGSQAGKTTVKAGEKKLSKKAPKIAGLKVKKTSSVSHAKLFKIFRYSKGVTLIQVDQRKYAMSRKISGYHPKKTKGEDIRDEVEQKEGKSQAERTEKLYRGKIVNYLVVPEGVDIPAGMEHSCIIIRKPEKMYTASQTAWKFSKDLGEESRYESFGFSEKTLKKLVGKKSWNSVEKKIDSGDYFFPGKWTDVNFRDIIEGKTKLAVIPSGALPHELDNKDKNDNKDKKEIKESLKKQKKQVRMAYAQLDEAERMFTALDIPVFIDRSVREKGTLAEAEWVKVYGAMFGCLEEANNWYKDFVKSYEKEKA